MKPKTDALKKADSLRGKPFYRLTLFVAGNEPNSFNARSVLARLCNERLKGRCEMRIVDVFEDYQAAIDRQVMVVPALIVESESPPRLIVGSLSDEGKVLAALGLSNESK